MLDILVVEDEAPIREWIAYTISNLSKNFNVVGTACNGKDGYDMTLKLKPQVILADIRMPIMDGIEMAKEVKKISKDIYIVILTNYAEFEYAKKAITYGVYEYFIKSDITPKQLEEILINIYNDIGSIENKKEFIDYGKNTEKENREVNKVKKESTTYSKTIERALKYIEENYKKHIALVDIAKHVYLSHEYFSRLFKDEVGENFSAYLTSYRMKKAENLLKNTDKKISQIAEEVGYSNSGYFSKTYKKYFGVSPDDDRY